MDIRQNYENNDLIYEMPPQDWWQGWLAGNGSGGATVWNPEDQLCMQLGHTDLLDRAPDQGTDNYGIPNMRHNLRAGIRIHATPLFDPFYLRSYHARTGLTDGVTVLNGESAFGRFETTFFYGKKPSAFVLRYREDSLEPLVRSFELEKRGSRFFSRIWSGTEPDVTMGLGTTRFHIQGDVIELTHEKEGFAMADVVEVRANAAYHDTVGQYSMERTYEACKHFEVEIRVFAGVEKPLKECLEEALAEQASAAKQSFEALLEAKRTEYAGELPGVGICLPQDPYFENLWYLSRHHMRSCYQGKFPAFFINGPFGGNRDKREWADCWLHWNMHDETLGVIKNGDWDLFRAFAEYKMRQIPSAKKLAREIYGCGGMVTQDQQKPEGGSRGRTEDYYKLQIYPCLHTSLLFAQYWRCTGDETFLREKLLPYLTLTLEFWKDYLVEEDGVLHVPRSHPYEFHNGYAFRDCITELSLLKACLPLLPEVEEAAGVRTPMGDWCRKALPRLADFTPVPVLREFVTREENGRVIYDNPFFYGEPYREEDRLLALGFSERKHTYVTHCHTHQERTDPEIMEAGGYGAFCSSQTSFVYPGLLVSSDDSPDWRERMHLPDGRRALWECGRNALRTIRRPGRGEQPGTFPVAHSETLSWTGHSLELPAFAKLGLTDQLRRAMEFYTQNYQMFPQGMFNYHPRNRWLLDGQRYTDRNGRQMFVPFSRLAMHFSLEELGVYTETVDLMLLDASHGLIRTFPAYDRDAQFCLPAEGGFRVEAVQKDGAVLFVRIESSRGGTCRVRTAWDACWLSENGKQHTLPVENAVVCFETKPGGTYLLTPSAEADCPDLTGHRPEPMKNGPVTLGLFPCFS